MNNSDRANEIVKLMIEIDYEGDEEKFEEEYEGIDVFENRVLSWLQDIDPSRYTIPQLLAMWYLGH